MIFLNFPWKRSRFPLASPRLGGLPEPSLNGEIAHFTPCDLGRPLASLASILEGVTTGLIS